MGSVNYIFANTGQTVRLIVQTLDGNGYPADLDGYGNWLDGYGYLLPDGYYSDPPDGYDGYINHTWIDHVRHTTSRHEWNRWWHNHNCHNNFAHSNCFDGYHCNDHDLHDCIHINYRGPNDGYYVPVVQQIIFPDSSLAAHYPRAMTRLGVGLYVHGITLPNGIPAIGTYIASISWMEIDNFGGGYTVIVTDTTSHYKYKWETYAINAVRPFGVTSVSPV